ncbi:hypothetical protein HDV00_003231 [Rhizophlyctis rosea]|nr:hypothetical protein HDV00_003231 [Rhizophlyctis rosea]
MLFHYLNDTSQRERLMNSQSAPTSATRKETLKHNGIEFAEDVLVVNPSYPSALKAAGSAMQNVIFLPQATYPARCCALCNDDRGDGAAGTFVSHPFLMYYEGAERMVQRMIARGLDVVDGDDVDMAGKLNGEMRRNAMIIKKFKMKVFWVHDACARCSPEIWKEVVGAEEDASVGAVGEDQGNVGSPLRTRWWNVAKAVRRGRGMKCASCKERGPTVSADPTIASLAKPPSFFEQGIIFWCPQHELEYYGLDEYEDVYSCDVCEKDLAGNRRRDSPTPTDKALEDAVQDPSAHLAPTLQDLDATGCQPLETEVDLGGEDMLVDVEGDDEFLPSPPPREPEPAPIEGLEQSHIPTLESEPQPWMTCTLCANDHFTTFDLCKGCFEDRFPEEHGPSHGRDAFVETSMQERLQLREMEQMQVEGMVHPDGKQVKRVRQKRKLVKRSGPRCSYCSADESEQWRRGYNNMLMCQTCFLLAPSAFSIQQPVSGNDILSGSSTTTDVQAAPETVACSDTAAPPETSVVSSTPNENSESSETSTFPSTPTVSPPIPHGPVLDPFSLELTYRSEIEAYSHDYYLTRTVVGRAGDVEVDITNEITPTGGVEVTTFGPGKHQLFSLGFDTSYYDVPGRAPRCRFFVQ